MYNLAYKLPFYSYATEIIPFHMRSRGPAVKHVTSRKSSPRLFLASEIKAKNWTSSYVDAQDRSLHQVICSVSRSMTCPWRSGCYIPSNQNKNATSTAAGSATTNTPSEVHPWTSLFKADQSTHANILAAMVVINIQKIAIRFGPLMM